MKTRITATAPTVYQSRSLAAFGMSINPVKNLDGSYTAEEEFESYEEAKKYLIQKAHGWYNSHDTTEEELNEMLADIEIYGNLTLDAVTASIEKFNR